MSRRIEFETALRGMLVGVSDASLDAHLALYERHARELEDVQRQLAGATWTPPAEAASMPAGAVQRLLETPIGWLPLSLDSEPIVSMLAQLRGELQARALGFWPLWFLGDDDFFTFDRATAINLPWYVGSPETWEMVARRQYAWSREDMMRVLRHEYAHALLYAYEGWRFGLWRQAFGDFERPYLDAYEPDTRDAGDYVGNLARPGPNQLAHYAQKHPDEDWAETFATWLGEPRWRELYTGVALAKLQSVDQMVVAHGQFYGAPAVDRSGPIASTMRERIMQTLGDYLGVGDRAQSQRAALHRRLAEAHNATYLHELHFEALGSGQVGFNVAAFDRFGAEAADLCSALSASFGAVDAWMADLRAVAAAASGWALACWDARSGRVVNALVEGNEVGVLAGARVLLAVDCWEHAYVADYAATGKHVGVAAQLANVRWDVVAARLRAAAAPAPANMFGNGELSVPAPVPVVEAVAAPAGTIRRPIG